MCSDRIDKHSLLSATEALTERDPDLATIVEHHGPPPLWGRRPGFATLALIILEQQVSLASARAAYRRLERGLGRISSATLANASLDDLRRLGITRQKALYCKSLAEQIEAKAISLRAIGAASDATARRMLTTIKGIGPWTADIYLLFALKRPDIWPEGDLALASAMQSIKRLRKRPSLERQARLAAVWRPWRSVAARLLWHAYLSERRMRSSSNGL
jgi:DNA-3-methyladenine glycosylase II